MTEPTEPTVNNTIPTSELLKAAHNNLINVSNVINEVVAAQLGKVDVNTSLALLSVNSAALQAAALAKIAAALEIEGQWKPS